MSRNNSCVEKGVEAYKREHLRVLDKKGLRLLPDNAIDFMSKQIEPYIKIAILDFAEKIKNEIEDKFQEKVDISNGDWLKLSSEDKERLIGLSIAKEIIDKLLKQEEIR